MSSSVKNEDLTPLSFGTSKANPPTASALWVGKHIGDRVHMSHLPP